jgi:hypothetical protein
MAPKRGPRTRPADCPRMPVGQFLEALRQAGQPCSRETFRRLSAKGEMPRCQPAGIPREEALKWLQEKADAAAAAAASLRAGAARAEQSASSISTAASPEGEVS